MPSARACFSARAESPRLLANGVPRVGSCHGPFSALPSAPCLARQRSGSAVNRLQDSHREGLPSRARPGRASRTVAASAAVGGEPATTVSFAADGSSKNVLVGDIGGTNARLQVWAVTSETQSELLFEKIYPTKDFDTFATVLQQVQMDSEDIPISAACFAVAGPVVDQVCNMTNLGWVIDKGALEKQFGYQVGVLNDFEAVGYGVRHVDPENMLVLNDHPEIPKAPIAVLGPGTGLGEAQLMWDESQGTYRVYPSEGSHADFAPRGWKQRALAQFVESELGYCEVESVGCGSGLERIYQFLSTDEASHQETLLANEIFMMSLDSMEEAHDPTSLTAPEISQAALDGTDHVAREAVDMMLSIIGAEAGHMALRCLARGGVYIAGGITPKVIDRVHTGGLATAFLSRKGRFHSFLRSVPLYVVMDDKVGLLGSKMYGIQLLKTMMAQS
eukprot:jgi/Tetstr1/462516/TSEL_007505.t1